MDRSDWYCIKFDLPPRGGMTALEFSKKMNSFLQEIENFNHSIVSGIDETYTVASYIEDMDNGSIKWWLIDKLSNLDDDAVDKLVDRGVVKSALAAGLKEAKKLVFKKLPEKIPLEEKADEIIEVVGKIIEEDDLPKNLLGECDVQIKRTSLLKSVRNMSEIAKDLGEGVSYIGDYDSKEETKISSEFSEYPIEEGGDETIVNTTIRNLVVYKPELSEDARKWSFLLDDRVISVDISETEIAKETVERGEVRVGDTYKVELREEQYQAPNGRYRTRYKIVRVLEFRQGNVQGELPISPKAAAD